MSKTQQKHCIRKTNNNLLQEEGEGKRRWGAGRTKELMKSD